MSGYDRWNKGSLCLQFGSDGADAMLFGKLFHSVGPAVENERSPTVTRRVGRTSRRSVSDDRRRRLDDMSATRRSRSGRYGGAMPWRARQTMTASLNWIRSDARSQWKLARVSVVRAERRRPAIDRAAALRTDWRRLMRVDVYRSYPAQFNYGL